MHSTRPNFMARVDLFGALSRSPIHVPLEVNLSAMRQDREWKGVSSFKTRELLWRAGVANEAYLSGSAFWIIHRDAIDQVYELAFRFFNLAREAGLRLGADAALGYAMQMLCANPEAHTVAAHPDVWVNNYLGPLDTDFPRCERWQWRHPLLDKPLTVRPSIVHLGATARGIPVETVSSEHQALP